MSSAAVSTRRSPPPSLQLLATAAVKYSMSSRPPYRGGGNQWRRGFSDRPSNGGRGQFGTGDFHFRSVGDTNSGFRQGGERGTFANQTVSQPQQFSHRPPYYKNQQARQPPPYAQSRQFQQPPPFDQNQAFRPQPQPQRRPPKPLDYRNWEYAKTVPPPNCERFLVLSYNLLADYLAINHRSKLYFHVPPYMMDWEWRKRNIMFELGLWSADIMCFQEVDRFQDLQEELKLRGYNGIWKMRTGIPVDGCAIFWRTSRFKLLHEECIEFNKLGLRDNVAQICVLELMSQNFTEHTAALSTSSNGYNRVVICNIHVLYNPRRGEIKFGQVRLLLDRAHAVSKIWNDAPVVLCGDFNCTPKSPLYNFISEQKLDLSGLDRDKVSGQASAEIPAPRPYRPNAWVQSADNSIQVSPMVNSREVGIKLGDSLSDMEKQNSPYSNVENRPFINNLSQPQCTDIVPEQMNVPDKSFREEPYRNEGSTQYEEVRKDRMKSAADGFQDETGSAFSVTLDGIKQSSRTYLSEVDNHSTSVRTDTESINSLDSEKFSSNLFSQTSFSDNVEASSSDSSRNLSSQSIANDEKGSPSSSNQINVLCASTSIDEKLENLSLNELDEATIGGGNIGEDDSTFLSALHSTEDDFSSEIGQSIESDNVELDCSSKVLTSVPRNPQLLASSDEVLDDFSPSLDSEPFDVKKITYDPSSWTPMEITTATGNAECTLLEHPLKLRSTYAEVEDCSGARDSNGEPLVTSYNRSFMGTVDYIWCSEGLQTVRVLAPIPKQAMQWTRGFPTKKWGSDHIALASELVFTKDMTNENM